MRHVIGGELGTLLSYPFLIGPFAVVLFCIETAISYVRFVLLSRTSVCFDKCPKAFSRTSFDKLLLTNGCATFACFSHTWCVVRLADRL